MDRSSLRKYGVSKATSQVAQLRRMYVDVALENATIEMSVPKAVREAADRGGTQVPQRHATPGILRDQRQLLTQSIFDCQVTREATHGCPGHGIDEITLSRYLPYDGCCLNRCNVMTILVCGDATSAVAGCKMVSRRERARSATAL